MFAHWLPGLADAVPALAILLSALVLDLAIGDLPWLYRIVAHPVAAVGALIGHGDRLLNDPAAGAAARFQRGLALTAAVTTAAALVGYGVAALARTFPGGILFEVLLASTLISFRGLYDHVRAVADGLTHGLEEGRAAVGHIVGRDPRSLDAAGVARAAIESTAESFSDGVVAPVFWFALFGLPGLAAYKAVNTLDSMIGHHDPTYEWFGKAAARLDDAANWVPARIAGLLIVCAAGRNAPEAWRTMWRDAWRHRSVNAGWQEAPMAGALGLALAGPRTYGAKIVDDHWMGDGRRDATVDDIRRALRVSARAWLGLVALVAAGAFL